MTAALVYREINGDDVEELAVLVSDAFAGYRAFAPPGWRPPPISQQISGLRRWVADPNYWGELASDGPTLAGHATFIPAERHSLRVAPDPSLAHLGHLFVRPPYWGCGVAAALLARATSAAAARNYTAMRLFVPAGQARARRFYGREGFTAAGKSFDIGFGLPLLEYRRKL